jgi:hypothetical protein
MNPNVNNNPLSQTQTTSNNLSPNYYDRSMRYSHIYSKSKGLRIIPL